MASVAKSPPKVRASSKFLAKRASGKWQKYTKTNRVSGRPLQRARTKLFWDEPLCRPCKRNGKVALATIRDHIIPLTEGGTEDEANIQPICRPCHIAKTLEESLRGKARAAAMV